MKDINKIVELSGKYLDNIKKQSSRYRTWERISYQLVKDTLHEICDELISQNEFFKSNLYVVDGNPEEGIYVKSGRIRVPGNVPLHEEGFQIHFQLTYNSKVYVFACEHMFENSDGKTHTIEIIDDLSILTKEKIIDLFYSGLEAVYKSSYLFF